jgi:FkbM family methyltransferase
VIISFAQNAEDVVLARAFRGQDTGFYIDVGAAHPVDHSVTKHFYDHGWRGLNIEPHPGFLELLNEERSGDVNVGAAVSDYHGEAAFHLGPLHHPGGSTLSAEVAAAAWEAGAGTTITVPVRMLSELFDEHVGTRSIDFLKIDVEGAERQVIGGCDWERWRPRVVVVEATAPNSAVSTHEAWEPVLLAAGYEPGLFDGLNRFYAAEEAKDLLELISVPANVFDSWVPARMVELERRLAAAENALRAGPLPRPPHRAG